MTWIPAQQCVLAVCLCRFKNAACQEIVFSLIQKTTNLKHPPSKKHWMHCSSNLSQCWVLASHCLCWTFSGSERVSKPTWCFTQHLSYHFWIWRWLNNLELILPLYITFLPRWTVTSSSLCSTHSTSGSVVLFSLKRHHLCSYSLMLWNLTCLWSVHTLSVWVHVFLMSKWWNCDVRLKHCISCSHTDTHSHSGFFSAAVLALTERHTLPTHGASLLTCSCQFVKGHQNFYTINDWDGEQ